MKSQALDHGAHLGGLGDDDHPHYHNAARHALVNHAGIPGVPPFPFVGMVVDSARPDVPSLWLECNGQAVSRTTYADLFAAISTQYGAGDGSTTFNVPNTVGRMRLHLDPGRTAWDTLGKTGGADTVALTTAQLAAHTHSGPSHSHSGPSHTHGVGTYSVSGGSHTHDIWDDGSFGGTTSRRALDKSVALQQWSVDGKDVGVRLDVSLTLHVGSDRVCRNRQHRILRNRQHRLNWIRKCA